MTTVAIMQPTYMPWVGYFAMMDSVDLFVFLDNVQFARRSWQQRNRILSNNGELMLTVPVSKKGRRDQLISEVEIVDDSDALERHRRSIENAYRKAPYFERYAGDFFATLATKRRFLADLNIDLITWFADTFGIRTPTKRASDIEADGQKAELIGALCAALEADGYVSAPGSRGYLEEGDALARRGIGVRYFDYGCAPYRQTREGFVPYLSAIDLLFNMGPQSLDVIRLGANGEPQHE